MNLTLLETTKTGFLVSQPKLCWMERFIGIERVDTGIS